MQFRFKALARLRQPDELDTPAVLTSPRGWIALLAVAAVTVAALAWAVFGRLPQTVSAAGLITRPYGTAQVQSLYSGQVTEISARAGGEVRAGQSLAVIRDTRGASHEITSLFAGQVVGVEAALGQVITAGLPVVTIERGGLTGRPVALLFVSPGQAAGITPGQSAGLAVAAAPSAAFGLLLGRVLAVGRYPLTGAEEAALTGGGLPAATLAADAGKLLVTVSLRRDRRTVSGYGWTTRAGPPQALPAVTPATGTITLGEQSPITLLFGP
ncbi:MAG TPA: biotin/lipoyl-containing protein [Streptosporangiaceae bacterium]